MNKIQDLEIIKLKDKKDERGILIPIEFRKLFNIDMKRSFLVFGKKNIIRGNHAHKDCNQFLCCIRGSCEVFCDDGNDTHKIKLSDPSKILKIPNMIWSSQRYISENTILLVLCDLEYSEKEYIREYKEFINYRKNKNNLKRNSFF